MHGKIRSDEEFADILHNIITIMVQSDPKSAEDQLEKEGKEELKKIAKEKKMRLIQGMKEKQSKILAERKDEGEEEEE